MQVATAAQMQLQNVAPLARKRPLPPVPPAKPAPSPEVSLPSRHRSAEKPVLQGEYIGREHFHARVEIPGTDRFVREALSSYITTAEMTAGRRHAGLYAAVDIYV